MRKNIGSIVFFAIIVLTLASCGKDVSDTTISQKSETNESHSSESSADEMMWLEATWTVATTIKIEASVYYVDGMNHKKLIHDTVSDDGGFGSHLIETHPALEDMEYIIEFDDRNAPLNVFCIQTHTDPVSIGCSGEQKKLDDWGFDTWEDVLAHYELNN